MLLHAAMGDRARVREVMASDPQALHARTETGLTPLMIAAEHGHEDVVLDMLASEHCDHRLVDAACHHHRSKVGMGP